ncbi:hypothetical protein ACFLUJ_03785 [Chloroflexota bacterium]
MTWQKMWQLAGSDYLKLVPILGLAFYIAFIPHLNYPYPLHVDEWLHMAYSKAMLLAGDTTFIDPFLGQRVISLGNNLEAGFHLFWGIFQTISGISWMVIFRFFPSIIFMITVLSVFVLARRERFGWQAALLTCLIPTTVGILGPGFLVPVSMGLLFTPLILFLAFNFRTIWSYLLIFVLISFLLTIHAPSAISPIIVLAPYILLNLKGSFKHSLGIAVALILPFLIIFPWILDMLLPTAKSLLTQQSPKDYVQLPRLLITYGYPAIGLCLLGTFLLVLRGGKKNYGLILGFLALLLMLVTFFSLRYGVSIMYERGLMYMMLVAGIIAGAGLAGVKNLRLPARLSSWLKVPLITQNAGSFLCLALIAVTLTISIPDRLDTPYYRMIDSEDYQAFTWIRDNISEDHEKAILDPWKATAFTAITDKNIYTRIHNYPKAKDNKAYTFFSSGGSDTAFLKENGISIIYSRVFGRTQNRNIEYNIDNPNLVKVAKNIYLLEEVVN